MSDNAQFQVAGEPISEEFELASSLSVGQRLAQIRERRGWSVQYVAEQLKLSQSQIVALESDQFEKLPKLVIVRGFVRAYAKLLRIESSELMSLMPQDTETIALEASLRPALATPFVEPRMSLTGHQEHNKKYVLGIVVLLLLVMVILFFQRTEYGQQFIAGMSGSRPDLKEASSATVVVDVPQSPAVNSLPVVVEGASVSAVSASLPESEAPSSVASAVAVSGAVPGAGVGGSAPSLELAREREKATTTSDVKNNSDKLVLRFKHDSWLFVKANGGAVLVSRLVRAGTEESFDVQQGLFVKIGNATDVEASLRGAPLAIVTERDSKVASLSVK